MSEPFGSPPERDGKRRSPRLSAFYRYTLPIIAVMLTLGMRLWLDPLLGESAVFIVYIPAVVAAAMIGGLGPTAVVIALSASAGLFHLKAYPVGLVHSFTFTFIFVAAGLIIAIAVEKWRHLNEVLREALNVTRVSLREAKASEERFRATFEQAAVGMAHMALDGRWLRFNERLCEITGYTRDDLHGLDLQSITQPADVNVDRAQREELANGTISSYAVEKRCIRKDGSIVWIRLTLSLIREASSRGAYYLAVIEDVSARHTAEATLRARTAELETLVDTAPVAICFSHDRDIQNASVNKYGRELLGLPPVDATRSGAALPLTHVRFFRRGVAVAGPETLWLQRAAEGERVAHEDMEARFDDGRCVTLLAHANPILNAEGAVTGAVSVVVDITLRDRMEAALRASEERFRLTVETVPNIVFMQRPDGSYEYVNPRYYEFTGTTPAEAEGLGLHRAVHPDDIDQVLASWGDAVRSEQAWQCKYRLQTADGSYRWVSGGARPVLKSDGASVRWLGVLSDIHDLVETAAELERQRGQLQLALLAGRLGSWELDVESGLVSGSEIFWANFAPLTRRSRKLAEMLRAIHPKDRGSLRAELSRVTESGGDFESEFRICWPDQSVRWVNLRGRVDRSSGRKRLLGVIADVTMRREAELLRAREAHREVIIQELRHRMGNLFPVILSVIRLTAPYYTDVPSYQRALAKRLQALEVTHGLLLRELAEAAFIEELVSIELAPYEQQGRTKIEGPTLQLTGGTAESFSMIVHELATNSAKHGALSTPTGKISVAWKIEKGEGDGERIVFEWKEMNGPEVRKSERQGYGSFIVGANGPPLVGDSATIEYLPQGLRYRLILPLTADAATLAGGAQSSELTAAAHRASS